MRLYVILFAFGIAAFNVLPAQAKSLTLKADPPGVWRVMTQDDATSTSKCIGKPKTPICAVEMIEACFLRKRWSLCKAVMGGNDILFRDSPERANDNQNVSKDITELYRFKYVGLMRKNDIPPWETDTREGPKPRNWKPGDVKVIMSTRPCFSGKCFPPNDMPPVAYQVRQTGKTWMVIAWSGDWK
jgi:hypothetical protein